MAVGRRSKAGSAFSGWRNQTRSHRLSILTRQELDELYGLPRFSDDDCLTYVELGEPESHVAPPRTVPIAAHLTMQLGDFMAKRPTQPDT